MTYVQGNSVNPGVYVGMPVYPTKNVPQTRYAVPRGRNIRDSGSVSVNRVGFTTIVGRDSTAIKPITTRLCITLMREFVVKEINVWINKDVDAV